MFKLSLCRWGSPHPPQYNYSLVTAPVALFWADGDLLVVPEDVATLANNLPNLVSLCHLYIKWQLLSPLITQILRSV